MVKIMKTGNGKPSNNSNNTQIDVDIDEFEEEKQIASKKWYEEIAVDAKEFKPVPDGTLIELKDEAKKCLDSEVASYNIKSSKTNTNYKWMKSIMSKGTVSDKLAAYTVLIQDNPIYNLDTIKNTIGMVKVSKKKECIIAMQNLTELFLSDLLKPNQKLQPFYQRPLSLLDKISSGNSITRRKYLVYWYFEDQLKELYTMFVQALNSVAHDTVDANKEKAIGAMHKLLEGNPEQEKNLLSHIINKLGDPSQKVASKAIYCLSQLLYKHPNMQGVVLTEVEKLLFRANVSTRAQYYGICFLSQFYLSHEDAEVAKRLIDVYFSFFKACVKKGEVDSRMMSALLMGVNRAYPYAKTEIQKSSEHVETMYRVVHIANFNVSIHALSLLYQVCDVSSNVSDRFYSALYRKLLDPKLFTTTFQAMLLNLLYKALSHDTEINRIRTFIKRLLQLAKYMHPAFTCGVLFLISQVISKKPDALALKFKNTSVFVDDDDDGEEKYVDIKEESCDNTEPKSSETIEIGDEDVIDLNDIDVKPDISILNSGKPLSSWYHCESVVKKENAHSNPIDFRPFSRNPLYAGGEYCAYVELCELKRHFHPTVSLFASQILNGETIKYSGDPLKDFTLIRFLDRFVFKNPKKREDISKQGSHPTFGKRKQYTPVGPKSLSVQSTNYLNQKEQNIPVDELFMYMFLQKRQKDRENKDDDSDMESVASDEFEEMLDKMTGHRRDEEDLDFEEDIQENMKSKKGKKKKGDDDSTAGSDIEDNEDDYLDDDIDDLSDEDVDDIENEDFEEDLDIDNEEFDDDFNDMDGLGDDELIDGLEDDIMEENNKNAKYKDKLKKLKKKNTVDSDFAPAEEFAALLEDEGSSSVKPGSSNAFLNKDKSGTKQLAWEEKRNHWLKGGHNKDRKNKKFNSKEQFTSRKRPNNKKDHGKNKKFKKL